MRGRAGLPLLALVAGALSCRGGNDALPLPREPHVVVPAADMHVVTSIGSDDESVYLGFDSALGAFDRARGYQGLLTGMVLETLPGECPPGGFSIGTVAHPSHHIRSGDWLYFDSWGYRIQRLFVGGNDGRAAIEVTDPQGLFQLADFAADDENAYWSAFEGSADGSLDYSVFARPHAGGPKRLLARIPGEPWLTVAAGRLYVISIDRAVTVVRAVALATGAVSTLHEGERVTVVSRPGHAASSTRFYWMDGRTLRAVSHTSVDPVVVAADLPDIRQLAADEHAVYAALDGTAHDEVLRVDLSDGSVTSIATRRHVADVLSYQGKVWWVSGSLEGFSLDLEAANPDGSGAEQVYTAPGELGFGGSLVGVGGHVASGGYRWLILHDTAAGTTDVFEPTAGARFVAADSRYVYVASENDGIARIPLHAPLRMPETLRGGLATVKALFLHEGRLYWSEWSSFAQSYRIARMREDGTEHEVLLEGDHRDLALRDGRLYFMCEATCGLPGWTLVSMALSGGEITPELPLGLWPQQLLARNGIFYVVDSDDGRTFGVWAIDPTRRRAAKVVSGLDFVGFELDASARFLYLWTWTGGLGTLERRPILAWDRLGAPERVDADVGAFHFSAGAVYYWQQEQGLKRFAE